MATYQLKYNLNGGSETIDPEIIEEYTPTQVTLPRPARLGATFLGWKLIHKPIVTHTGSMFSAASTFRYKKSEYLEITDIGLAYRTGALYPTSGSVHTDGFTYRYTFNGDYYSNAVFAFEGKQEYGANCKFTLKKDGSAFITDGYIDKNNSYIISVANGSDYGKSHPGELSMYQLFSSCLCGKFSYMKATIGTKWSYEYNKQFAIDNDTNIHTIDFIKTDTGTSSSSNYHNCGYFFLPAVIKTYAAGETITVTLGQDEELVAQWENQSNTITYHSNGGSMIGEYPTTYNSYEGCTLPTSANINRYGMTFQGWYADSELTDGPYTSIANTEYGDKVFYAKWKIGALICNFQISGSTENTEVSYDTFSALKTNITQNAAYMDILTNVTLSGKGTDTDASKLFYDCDSISYLNLEGLDTSNITNMSNMFALCGDPNNITFLANDGFVTSKVTKINSMLATTAISFDYNTWDVSNVTEASNLFSLRKLEENIDISSWNLSKCTTLENLFSGSNVKTIKLPNTLPKQSCNIASAFCADNFALGGSLTTIECNQSWTDQCAQADTVFGGTPNLVGVINFDSTKVSSAYANPNVGYFIDNHPFYKLWIKANGKTKSYTCVKTQPAKPYLNVNGQYLSLTEFTEDT